MQRHNFDMYTHTKPNIYRHIHATEQAINSLLQRMEYHTHPVRCIVADKDQQLWYQFLCVCVTCGSVLVFEAAD